MIDSSVHTFKKNMKIMMHADSNDLCSSRVIRLREWGSDRSYPLPPLDARGDMEEDYEIRVGGTVSASLGAQRSSGGKWWIQSVGPESLWADGDSQSTFALVPGMEVRIGKTMLIAETEQEVKLRAYLQRLLGWGADRQRAVDHALRALRLARTRRAALVLQGDGDLVPIAYGLHRQVLGSEAPFVVCDPRRTETAASVRSPTNVPSAAIAVAAAAGGSLCVRHRRLPKDFDKAQRRLIDPRCNVQLYVCMEDRRRDVAVTGVVPVELPPLGVRDLELPRIIDEYAKEARTEFNASPDCFRKTDQAWIRRHARSMGDIEKATSRIVAVRSANNLSQAAALLGMAQVSLSRWLARRSSKALWAKQQRGE